MNYHDTVSLLEAFFCEKVYVEHFDGKIYKERTKVINGVRFVSCFGWCGKWNRVNNDGTFVEDSFQIKWGFKLKQSVMKPKI